MKNLIKDKNINILDLVIFILQTTSIITGFILFIKYEEPFYLLILVIAGIGNIYWAIRNIYCETYIM